MRGTDLTDAQLQSAREFAVKRQAIHNETLMLDDVTVISLRFGDLVRLIAWYGALRYTAGKTGVGGTLDEPGPMEVKP